jgi:hypothetical protein
MDETKKYLINVESNLSKYAEEAVVAKKKIDELKKSNDDLKDSGTASAAEIETSNAALRNAQKEYNQSKKLVDLQTQANNSNINSRKQLAAIVELEQKRLGSLANQYTINDKEQRVLSQDYIDSVKNLKGAKDAVIAYDKAQSDGRSSIGLYSEAIQGALGGISQLPGPVGQAATAINTFKESTVAAGKATKAAWMTNPITIAIAAIIAVVVGLIAIFKKFEPVVEAIERAMAGIKAVFTGVSNTIIGLVTGQKTLKESFSGLGESIKQAYDEGVKWKQLQQDLQDMTSINAVADAKRKTQIDELMLQSRNRSKSEEERMQLINQALLLEEVQYSERKKIADAEVSLAEQALTKGRGFTAEELKLLREKGVAYAVELQKEKNISDEEVKAYSDALVAQEQISNESIAIREKAQTREDDLADKADAKREKAAEQAAKEKNDAEKKLVEDKAALDKEINDYKQKLADLRKIDAEDVEKKKKAHEELIQWRYEKDLINEENILQILEDNSENQYAIKRKQLTIQQKAEIKSAEKTGADVNIINAKYAAKQRLIDKAESDAKLSLYADFAGNLANIFGKETKIGKAAAVVQTTINTYKAAMSAYADTPGGVVLKLIAAASATATGIAAVKNILAVDTDVSSGSTSATATSITTTHTTAAAATTVLTPQLSQSQLNSSTNSGALNADDIATAVSSAISELTIVTTIEDINAKQKSTNKIVSKANI